MSAKHRDPEFLRNARLVRQRVARLRRAGEDVWCRRCRGLIDVEQRFDVGHVEADGGPGLNNLEPEHRRCNRSAGGKVGAARASARRVGRSTAKAVRLGGTTSTELLDW